MKKVALIFGLVLSMTAIGAGQVRTVTNSTLQKFQEKRLAAERDYRENYARLGFPSPEDLDRQREKDTAARLSLVVQLRDARLEIERSELESRRLDLEGASLDNAARAEQVGSYDGYGGYLGNYGGGYYPHGYYRRYHGYSRNVRIFNGGGYRATPVGVYPLPSTRPLQRIVFGGRIRGVVHTGRN